MTMTIQTTPSSKMLYVLADGEFDLDEAKRTFAEVVQAIVDNKSERVLFDGRSISGEPKIIERFFYGEFVADAVTGPIENRAIATSPQFAYILLRPVLDPERLGETVAVNRGMNVKTFESLTDGMAWLGVPPGV